MQAEHLELYALGELPQELSEESCAITGRWPFAEDEHPGREKRRGPRVATDDPAVLTILEPRQPGRMNMKVVDASKQGLKLLVPSELVRGAVVQIRVRDFFIMAEIRHCHAAGSAFHVGVQIQDVFPVAS